MRSISENIQKTMTSIVVAFVATFYLAACGSKPDPGSEPKPPWPDSPGSPSFNRPQGDAPIQNKPVGSPSRIKAEVAIIALADVWVLVKPEGQKEIWKNLRQSERLVIPKTGKLAISYSSGKNIQIEAAGRVIKPSGGTEGIGFIDID